MIKKPSLLERARKKAVEKTESLISKAWAETPKVWAITDLGGIARKALSWSFDKATEIAIKELEESLEEEADTSAIQTLDEQAQAMAFLFTGLGKVSAIAERQASRLSATNLAEEAITRSLGLVKKAALAKAKVLTLTATSAFQRDVVQRATAARSAPTDSERYWVYVGPDDRITRPFCESLAGKAIPDRLLDQLANGQGLPVRRFCGGYNCRHALIPVSERYVAANELEEISTSDVRKINAIARSR